MKRSEDARMENTFWSEKVQGTLNLDLSREARFRDDRQDLVCKRALLSTGKGFQQGFFNLSLAGQQRQQMLTEGSQFAGIKTNERE